jgi:hypothetical protein
MWLKSDDSELPIGPIFKDQAVQEEYLLSPLLGPLQDNLDGSETLESV